MKKLIGKLLTGIAFCTAVAGVGFLKSTPVSADVATAEWVAGNDNVNVTMNYDITNSEYSTYAFTQGNSTTALAYNEALETENFWTKDSYYNLKPMFYETVAGADDPSISLGYYDGDFGMTFTPAQSVESNTYDNASPYDYLQVLYTFTDTVTGDSFSVQIYQAEAQSRFKNVYYKIFRGDDSITVKSGLAFSFGGRYNADAGTGTAGTYNFFHIKYDVETNQLKLNPNLGLVRNLSTDIGLTEAYDTYKVDMTFGRITANKTAKMCVYYLNGYDLTAETDNDIASNGAVIYQKATDYACVGNANVPVSSLVGAWDPVLGDVSEGMEYTVKDAQGQPVTVTDGYFKATTGEYTVSATMGSATKEITVLVDVPVFPTAEWAVGNDDVNVTMNYDITNSNYGESGDTPGYWRIRNVDSNTLTGYNAALQAEEFWYKTNYVNLKPMFYETVTNAEDPSINLGYYDGDFKTTSTPVQSIVSNSQENCDYYGIIYTFTDTVTGEYFSVKMYNTAAKTNQAQIAISVNGGEYQGEKVLTGSFGGRFNGTKGSPQTGVFYLLNLKYDQDENKIKYYRDLSQSFDLSEYGLSSAFETYKVDLSFDRIQEGKTAKLCVYYLNGYDLTANITEQEVQPTVLVQGDIPEVVFRYEEMTMPTVLAWDAFDGDLDASTIETSVLASDTSKVDVSTGKFAFEQEGEYTITYRVTAKTNERYALKTFTVNVLGSIPVATVTLDGGIPEEFGVGGTLRLPAAAYTFEGESVSGYTVVMLGSKVIESFDDTSVAHKLLLTEKGTYKISYVYTSKYGYNNAYTYTVECIDALAIVDPMLPKQIDFNPTGYTVEPGEAVFGDTPYEATVEILSPTGKTVDLTEDRRFVPEEIGVYTFTYTAEANGQTATERYQVDVQYDPVDLLVPNSYVEEMIGNTDADYVLNENLNGVAVVIGGGGEVCFANVVDLSKIGLAPIIQFQTLAAADGYSYINNAIVTLTDVYDESNTVKIKWERNSDNEKTGRGSSYISINVCNNGYCGLDASNPNVMHRGKYGTNVANCFKVDQFISYAFNICLDYADKEFKFYNAQKNVYTSVLDADDLSQVGDGKQWKGFTTGEVYISWSTSDATASNTGVIITSVAGQSLAGTTLIDSVAPAMVVKTEREYLENKMPDGVVGVRYPIPETVANDLVSGRVATELSVLYLNGGEEEEVAFENGGFTPQAAGTYKLVWAAKDVTGNIGTTELTVEVFEETHEISVAYNESVEDVYIGDKVYIPEIQAHGGNGKLSWTTEWFFNGEKIDFEAPEFYRADAAGALTARVAVRDYLGNEKIEELTIEIGIPELPVISVADVPTSAVKGTGLVLPDFTAIDHQYAAGETGYYAQRKILVNGTEIDMATRTYHVTQEAGESLTVQYVAIGRNGQNERTFYVNVLNPTYISDYFVYDRRIVASALDKSYTEFSAVQDFSVALPNPVSVEDMAICFYADDALLAAGGMVSVLLTDANDPSLQIKLTLTFNEDGEPCLYLNQATDKMLAITPKSDGAVYFAFNNTNKQINDAQGARILGVDKASNGFAFSGFESGAANVTFTVNGVTERAYLRINQVGNQRFITSFKNDEPTAYVDTTAGQLTYEFAMGSTTMSMGDTVWVSAAKAFDVLQNNASVTVTVESPTRTLFANVAIDRSFSFTAEEYGYYRITYTVRSGNRTDRLPSHSIKIKDEEPPTITVSGEVASSCKVGATLTLPNATAGDNVTEWLTLYVFVIEPNGRYVNVTEGLSYEVTKSGNYKVVYYVVDNDYNIARVEYAVAAQ